MAKQSVRRGVKPIHKIYRYVVKYDTGVAPNVDGGICTLALCKPRIRRCAKVNSWVVGLWPAPNRKRVTYVMQVGEIVPLAKYWDDRRFAHKKPKDHKRPKGSRTPDNIYWLDSNIILRHVNIYQPDKNGIQRQVNTSVHPKPSDWERDLGGVNVLVAKRFWYFGGMAVKLPKRFHCLDLSGSGQGHRIACWEDSKMNAFISWLEGHGSGVLGTPRNPIPKGRGRCT